MDVGLKILNLGCGSRFHLAHTNVDFVSTHPCVSECDLRQGIPLLDASFDVVYHSHLLEHFSSYGGEFLISECARVLRTGGILRIAVPDLQKLAEDYLQTLKADLDSDEVAIANHRWMLLELYDQTVRTTSGGMMKAFLLSPQLVNRAFVVARIGSEALGIVESAKMNPHSRWKRLRGASMCHIFCHVYQTLAVKCVSLLAGTFLGGRGIRSFQEGWFRTNGEIHRQMYDFILLRQLLRCYGFQNITRQDAVTSRIPGWNSFLLDSDQNGIPHKPDSLWVEAVKSCSHC